MKHYIIICNKPVKKICTSNIYIEKIPSMVCRNVHNGTSRPCPISFPINGEIDQGAFTNVIKFKTVEAAHKYAKYLIDHDEMSEFYEVIPYINVTQVHKKALALCSNLERRKKIEAHLDE